MENDLTGPYILGAFLGGCVVGLVPLLLGKYLGNQRLGDIGFLLCVAASILAGAVGSFPTAIIFAIAILFGKKKNENT